MILLVIAPWPFVSHGSSDNWRAFFLGGIQSTKWVLLEISLNFWRCCFWLCCASFSFCFGTIIQRFASGKMRILEAKCWNMSLDVFVLLMACAQVKCLSLIYFRNLRGDIYWIYVSNLLRRKFHRFPPFSPKRTRVSKEKAGRRGKTGHQSGSILDRCHPCTSERWGQTLDKFPHE